LYLETNQRCIITISQNVTRVSTDIETSLIRYNVMYK